MAKFKLTAGAEVDVLTKDELDSSLKTAREIETAHIRAVKWMRLPETLSGTAASSVLTLGETKGQVLGPRSGYNWVFRRLVVTGLTSGATPDVVNLYRGTPAGAILWQFNGNNFGYTFGKLELSLVGGETLALASTGTFNSTSSVILSGELLEVPSELMGKLA